MSSAIESVKDHYKSLGIKKVDVPEWNLTIYAKPLTLSEMSKMRKVSDNELELMAQCLLIKCIDENGEKIFNQGDKHDLMHNADQDVLARVAGEIMKVDPIEKHEKK